MGLRRATPFSAKYGAPTSRGNVSKRVVGKACHWFLGHRKELIFMDNPRPGPGRIKEFPLRICEACGGNWFREASFYEFLREEFLTLSYLPTPDLAGQLSWGPKTIGVCLCGRPWSPLIGGVHGGHTPNAELTRFMFNLKQAQDRHGGEAVLQVAIARLTPQQEFQILTDRFWRGRS